VRDLSDRGLPAFAQAIPGGPLQVLVGPYISREEAADVQRQILPLNYTTTSVVTVQP
jgi:hypothetical protein